MRKFAYSVQRSFNGCTELLCDKEAQDTINGPLSLFYANTWEVIHPNPHKISNKYKLEKCVIDN